MRYGFVEYTCFQVYLFKYDDNYYTLSQPTLMRNDDNVLMLQGFQNMIEAKLAYCKMIERLGREYQVCLIKDTDIE